MLNIADRRAIMLAATGQNDFRDLLRNDPRAAIHRATGRDVSADARVTILEEHVDAWEFVIPANPIEATLPPALDLRGTIENDVYALLRDRPETRAQLLSDPKSFVAAQLGFDIGDAEVNIHAESPDELLLILPYEGRREELSDAALDLVAGGGDIGFKDGDVGEDVDSSKNYENENPIS